MQMIFATRNGVAATDAGSPESALLFAAKPGALKVMGAAPMKP